MHTLQTEASKSDSLNWHCPMDSIEEVILHEAETKGDVLYQWRGVPCHWATLQGPDGRRNAPSFGFHASMQVFTSDN
jgi:hypothetical protein